MSDTCAKPLNDIWNKEIMTTNIFQIIWKLADVTPVFKKDASLWKNYRPVSVLIVVSKIYETIMQKHILEYIDKDLSPRLVDIEKVTYSTLTTLIPMLEKWKLSLNNKGFAGGVLMD